MDDILDLSGVARVVGMPRLRVRNWTAGRPLKIRPSVRAAIGKGSRNLYNERDVFKMATAKRLREDGLNFRLIQYVLDHVDLENFADGASDWLVIHARGTDITFEVLAEDAEGPIILYNLPPEESHMAIKLSPLLGEVAKRIEEYVKTQIPED